MHFKSFLKKKCSESIFFHPFSETEIIDTCLSLKNSSSCDFDGLNIQVVKNIIHVISKPLFHIFNPSLSTGNIPSKLKIAKVVPIFKKGDHNLITNYRPISILPCLSKIIEKCVYNRIYNLLTMHDLISPDQYGFRPNHSTTHALMDLNDRIIKALSGST